VATRASTLGWVAVTAALAIGAIGIWRIGRSAFRDSGGIEHPSILFVTIDTLRADHTSTYGYARPTTPRLDALAQRGVRCAAAYAPMAATVPSHASMFTSLLPRSHGLVKNGQTLAPQHRRLAEVLSERGYVTAAFVSSFAVNRRFGLASGFATYDDDFTGAHTSLKMSEWAGHPAPEVFDRRASETRVRVVDWLRQNGYLEPARAAAPFFLWVHLFDPHDPYDPPPGDRAKISSEPLTDALQRAIADYDAEIHFADREMGAILDALAAAGRLDQVLTIVVGDHGEGLMQHGHMYHGLTLYEEQVRVPLVFHWPRGLPKPLVIEAPVEIVDLAPTVLELAGLPPVPGFRGTSLARAMRGQAVVADDRPVFLQRRHYDSQVLQGIRVIGEQLGVRRGRWKYIEAPEEGTHELFDLAADPGERQNLFGSRPEQSGEFAALLHTWTDANPSAPVAPVSPQDAERLHALGYVE